MCTFVQAEDLLTLPRNVGPSIARAAMMSARQEAGTLASRTLYWSVAATEETLRRYGGLLESVTLTETILPTTPLTLGESLQFPVQKEFDFSYVPQAPELTLLQDFVQETNGNWIRYHVDGHYHPATFYAFITLVQKDVAGLLDPADQKQLYTLFAQGFDGCLDAQGLEDYLELWRATTWQDETASPKLPTRAQLLQKSYFTVDRLRLGGFSIEWELAANIYLAQRVYGLSLPASLQQINVLPDIIPQYFKLD